ncbi:hypothetical protein IW261DRAFT_1517283 [Armillaria novae-zelandiae]|uniref:Uncharacterized protein n=1 Tax=Armillaria novae-zelandiae TaxID=153914 RepID=A0AA39NNF2_9AGAR|nr:hypothetical protein IW261DRAFT_1517283 [Armillaria novae-zelandiae]
MDDWEVPVSEIRSWTYTLVGTIAYTKDLPLIVALQIDVLGFDTVVAFRNKALEGSLDERGVQLLVHWGQENHAAVTNRVRAWRNNIAVIPSHLPPIHPFDAHRRVFSFFNDEPYTPGEAPDDAPTLKALIHEYNRWFLLTLLKRFRCDDAKASEGWNILWHLVRYDPYMEPYDCEDFMRGKRNNMTQNHRASRDELTNTVYDNTILVSPLGLTTTTPSQASRTLSLSPNSSCWHIRQLLRCRSRRLLPCLQDILTRSMGLPW